MQNEKAIVHAQRAMLFLSNKELQNATKGAYGHVKKHFANINPHKDKIECTLKEVVLFLSDK